MHAKSLQSCPTLCNPMDCSSPGSSVHGILSKQEYWNGLPCPPPGDPQAGSLSLASPQKPHWVHYPQIITTMLTLSIFQYNYNFSSFSKSLKPHSKSPNPLKKYSDSLWHKCKCRHRLTELERASEIIWIAFYKGKRLRIRTNEWLLWSHTTNWDYNIYVLIP